MYRNKVNKITNKNMKKDTIKLNEQQLRQIVAESVKRVLNEKTNWKTASDFNFGAHDQLPERYGGGLNHYVGNMAESLLAKYASKYANELVYRDTNASEKSPREKSEMAAKIGKELYGYLTKAVEDFDEEVFDRYGLTSY